MQQETAKKLLNRYGHQLLLVPMRIILPAEHHIAVKKGNQPVIGYRNGCSVPGISERDSLRQRAVLHTQPIGADEGSAKRNETLSYPQGIAGPRADKACPRDRLV